MEQLRADAGYLELTRVAKESGATEMVTLLRHVGWNRPDGLLSIHKKTSRVGRQAFAAVGFTEEGPTGAPIPEVLARAARWSISHGFGRLAQSLTDFINTTWPENSAGGSENPLHSGSVPPSDDAVAESKQSTGRRDGDDFAPRLSERDRDRDVLAMAEKRPGATVQSGEASGVLSEEQDEGIPAVAELSDERDVGEQTTFPAAPTQQGERWWFPFLIGLLILGVIFGMLLGDQLQMTLWAPALGAGAGIVSLGTSNLFPSQKHKKPYKVTTQFAWACISAFALGLTFSAASGWPAL